MTTRELVPVGLRCGHKVAPLAVEADRVSFSWALEGQGRWRRQSAYQLRVAEAAGSPAGELQWDTGRVELECSTDVAYEGPPLHAAREYRWRARVWDEEGRAGPWSSESSFETALGEAGAWGGCWVGLGRGEAHFAVPSGDGRADSVLMSMKPAPYLRRAFTVGRELSRARLYATARGAYELSINGQRVGDAVLAPGWTDYDQRCLYQAYDVSALLMPGDNVLGAIVADAWACGYVGFDAKRRAAHYAHDPELLAVLVVQYADGTEQRIVTDDRWRSSTGAVVYADLLMGERRELAFEPEGWDRPGYDASSWLPVSRRELGSQLLVADPGPPVRVIEEVLAARLVELPGEKVIVDFGQNLAGWVRLKAQRPAGTAVEVRHGEMLNPDGTLYVENLRTARQTDSYVTTGATHVLEPHFTFHGFRYAEISGLGDTARPEDITACVVHSDIPCVGNFECSSNLVNKLYSNIDWSQRANFISVPTDCPQRDERLGWLGDAQIFARAAAYNRDVAAFFSKWLDDVADAQLPSGAFPDFAPRLGYDWAGSPAWADAGVIVPWTIYKMYGDKGVLQRHFGAMASWMDFLAAHNPGKLWTSHLGNNYGDWLAPKGDSTPRELLATAYWAYDASLMAEIAQAIRLPGKAEEYLQLAAEVRTAFQGAYLHTDGSIESGAQTAYVLALHMSLVPEGLRPLTASHLVKAIADEGWHIATGFAGVGYILPVLSANGYADVAYRLLEQRSYPSWLYSVDHGATTIWERWDGWTPERGFQSPNMNSFNHYSLGSVGEWLYRFVLGIELAPDAAGFDRLALRPHPGGSLSYARGSFQSARGMISSSWVREGGRFRLDVELPPNVTASVHVPSAEPEEVVGPDGE
ncbi:MAG: glycoside hydrolase family 78 protein, partial [Acidimicrobiales bacterium]